MSDVDVIENRIFELIQSLATIEGNYYIFLFQIPRAIGRAK